MHQHLVAFQLPERIDTVHPKLGHWADLIASGRSDKLNEKGRLPDFLTDFFVDLLGYLRPADGGQRYTLSREKHVQVDGKFADAVLGTSTATSDRSWPSKARGPRTRSIGRSLGGSCQRCNRATSTPSI